MCVECEDSDLVNRTISLPKYKQTQSKQRRTEKQGIGKRNILKISLPARSLRASFSSRTSLIFISSLLISLVNTSISPSLILICALQFFISITASSKPYTP